MMVTYRGWTATNEAPMAPLAVTTAGSHHPLATQVSNCQAVTVVAWPPSVPSSSEMP